jgi:uncharacterized damage-inducible protein DinB
MFLLMAKEHTKETIKQLKTLLKGGTAHASLKDALHGLPAQLRGVVPDKLPYSIWQLLYHIHITTWDMLEFSKGEEHKSPKWPDEYWPKEKAPQDDKEWDKAVKETNEYIEEFIALLEDEDADIYAPFPHGEGQNLLSEALQMADHTSYHTAEIIVLRRLLGAWK